MRRRNAVDILAMAVVVVASVGLVAPAPARAQDLPVTFNAHGINLSNVGRSRVTQLQITIERWSTEAERDVLRDALIEKGGDALLPAIQKIKPRAGFIRRDARLGWNIQYARRTDLPDGGYRVVVATDRAMSFAEAAQSARSTEYEFLLAELRIGSDGKGTGKFVPRAKISYDREKETIAIEDYASLPIQLTQVTVSSPKKK
jgi:hypothetical protein